MLLQRAAAVLALVLAVSAASAPWMNVNVRS